MKGLNGRLLLAAEAGAVDILKKVVGAGADVQSQDRFGFSSLHKAVLRSHLDTVRFLCNETNIDLYLKDSEGQPALLLCRDQAILRFLAVDAQVDLSRTDASGESVLFKFCRRGYSKCLYYLVADHSDDFNPNLKSTSGDTALHVSVRSDRQRCVQILLAHPKIDPLMTDSRGRSALVLALERRSWPISSFLVRECLEREAHDGRYGSLLALCEGSPRARSPLHIACACGQVELARLLLSSASVRASAPDGYGCTSLLHSCRALRTTSRGLEGLALRQGGSEAADLRSSRESLLRVIDLLLSPAAAGCSLRGEDQAEAAEDPFAASADGLSETPVSVFVPSASLRSLLVVRDLDLRQELLRHRMALRQRQADVFDRDNEILRLRSRLAERDKTIALLQEEKTGLFRVHEQEVETVARERTLLSRKHSERIRLSVLERDDREETLLRSIMELKKEMADRSQSLNQLVKERDVELVSLHDQCEVLREELDVTKSRHAALVKKMRRRIQKLTYRQDDVKERIARAKQTLQWL